ncbi:hypothetical protein FRC06_006579, partial [Ceratobasidium sp. 370]
MMHSCVDSAMKDDEILIEAQSFSNADSNRRDFQVSTALISASQQAAKPLDGVQPIEMSKAFVQNWTSTKPKAAGGQATLKEAEPFVAFSGWGDFVAKQDISLAMRLLDKPDEGPLDRLYRTAYTMFMGLMEDLGEVHIALRRHATDEQAVGGSKALIPMQSQEQKERHASTWALFLVYVMRVYDRQKNSQTTTGVTFTPNQQSWLDEAWKYAKKSPGYSKSRPVLLGLSAALWAPEDVRHLLRNSFDDIVIQFAIFSNVEASGSFFQPGVISSFLARMKYIMRLTTIMWVRDKNEKEPLGISWMFKHITKTLRSNEISPYSSIYEYMGLASTYDKSGSRLGRVHWVGDQRTELVVDGKTWNIPALRRANGKLVDDIDDGIKQLLFGMSPSDLGLHLSPDMEIFDRHSDRTPGYSFLTEPQNGFHKLAQNLGASILGRREGKDLHRGLHNNKVVWNPDAVRHYLALHEQVTEKMALSWHLSGGQPARSAEFATMSLTEDIHRPRAVIMLNGQLVYLIQYSKLGAITRSDKAVAHCIPWALEQQFLVMNILIRPFVGQLVRDMFGEERQLVQEHALFATWGNRMKPSLIGDRLRWFFETNFGIEGVGANAHRQGVVEIQRKLIPTAADTVSRSLAVVDAQAGHTSETAAMHYGLDSAERRAFLSTTISKFILVSILWWPHILPSHHLTPKEVHGSRAAPTLLAEEQPLDVTVMADRIGEHLNRSLIPRVEDLILQAQTGITADFREALNRIFYGADSTMAQPPAPTPPKAQELLRRWTGSRKSTWTSPGQAKAMATILACDSSVLCVLPTSGGKSFLFSSLPSIEMGITLVIVPLVALLQKQEEDLTANAISWSPWDPTEIPSSGLVMAKSSRVLNRIVFDEAHLAITSDFRPVMDKLKALVEVGVPIVALSATVPPVHQPRLRNALGTPSWTIIREPTQRRNISYRIGKYRSFQHAMQALKLQVDHFRSQLAPGDAILIHCRLVKHLDQVGKELHIPTYHAKLGKEDKASILNNWFSGNQPILASTSALGAGIHHSGCRASLHFGSPWGLVELVQESGRAGRDGRPAVAGIFHWGIDFDKSDKGDQADVSGLAQLHQLLDSTTCLREHMSAYIDGETAQVTCSMGYAPCGPCQVALEHARTRQGTDLGGPDYWEPKVTPLFPTQLLIESFDLENITPEQPLEMEQEAPLHQPLSLQGPPSTPPPTHRFQSPLVSGPLSDDAMIVSPPAPPISRVPEWHRRPTFGQGQSPTGHLSHAGPSNLGQGITLVRPSLTTIDAQRAGVRQLAGIQAAQRQARTPLSFTLPRIIAAKTYITGCCVYCLVERKQLQRHALQGCPHRDMGACKQKFALEEVDFDGLQYKDVIKSH